MVKGLAFAAVLVAASARADDYPIKQTKSFTWTVDYEASWSPDGKQIVLISSRHGGMKVHTLRADSDAHGSDMKQLTAGDAEDDAPMWSPDGKHIVFVSMRDGVSQVFVMNADGSDVKQLTTGKAENIHPTWAPDGKRILFDTTQYAGTGSEGRDVPSDNKVIGEQLDKHMDLATIKLDGTDEKRITTGGGYTYASFSPDGRSILHRRIDGAKSQTAIMDADGSHDRVISGDTIDGWPSWSPDGKRVVLSRRVDDRFQIFVIDRDGKHAQQITSAAGELVGPRWSPDGKTILCSRRLGDMTLVMLPAPH